MLPPPEGCFLITCPPLSSNYCTFARFHCSLGVFVQATLNRAAGFDLEKGGSRRDQKAGKKRR